MSDSVVEVLLPATLVVEIPEGARGLRGRDPLPAEIDESVTDYLEMHPPQGGPPGRAPTAEEITAALNARIALGLDAGIISTGVFDPARIPVIGGNNYIIPASGTITGMTAPEQAQVKVGTNVILSDGRRFIYGGAGSKIVEANYVLIADVTPEWAAIANKPLAFPPTVHSHSVVDIIDGRFVPSAVGQPAGRVLTADGADGYAWAVNGGGSGGSLITPVIFSAANSNLTNAQTTFVIPGGFTPSSVAVYLNGARLVDGVDFDANTSPNIVLTTGVVSTDTLYVGVANSAVNTTLPAGGGVPHFLRGDRTWQLLNAAAIADLGSLATKNSILNSDFNSTVPAKVYAAVASRKANAVGDFGCPTDQTSDCRTAVQTGIDAIASRGGGAMEVPPINMGLGAALFMRDAVVLEGTGGAPPVGPGSSMNASCFYPLTNNMTLITQQNLGFFLHSAELRNIGLDGRRRVGRSINNGFMISGGNFRVVGCHIFDFNGNGGYLRRSTGGNPCWTHWLQFNVFGNSDVNLNCEATDSYFGFNYFVNAVNINVILNGPGANTLVGNHIDNAGMNGSGVTVNPNAIGLYILNQGFSGSEQYVCCNELIANTFISNPCDVYVADMGGITLGAGHTFNSNRHHDGRGGSPIFIGNNNNGGQIVGTMFKGQHAAGNACVVFAGGNTNTEWTIGPNGFTDVSIPHYANLPAWTTGTPGAFLGVS